MSAPSPTPPLAFGEFLKLLKRRGFDVGVEHHLRLQLLLDRVDGRCSPEDLKTLLCPLFAKSEAEQETFYRTFDSHFEIFHPGCAVEGEAGPEGEDDEPDPDSPQTPEEPGRRRKRLAYAALALAGLALFAWFILIGQNGVPVVGPQTSPTPPPASPTPTVTPKAATRITPRPPVSPTPTPPPVSFASRDAAVAVALLAPTLAFLLYELYRHRRRRLIIRKARRRVPPDLWPLLVPAPTVEDYRSRPFRQVSRALRRRQSAEFKRLDVEATVAASVASLGYPRFQFRSDSRPPEYLILIDRASFRDHLAQLFESMVRAFDREGLYYVSFFYKDDPRVCWSESAAGRHHLADLRKKFPEHRLILFGDGERLVNPLTGDLENWVSLLQEWPERAILTPESPGAWGLREKTLGGTFLVLPATLEGLNELSERLEGVETEGAGALPARLPPAAPERNHPGLVHELREALGDDVFQWLCACAVYPELSWELTLYLGAIPSMPGGLLREENLLKLVRLPWFRRGAIPEDVRLTLMAELDAERWRGVRAAIVGLLDRNDILQTRPAPRPGQMSLALDDRPPGGAGAPEGGEPAGEEDDERDYALLEFLEAAPASRLSLSLPLRLRRYLGGRGWSPRVFATGLRALLAALFIAGGLVLAWRVPAKQGSGVVPPKPGLRVVVMDVGQGDSILIVAPSGRAALIDAGAAGNGPNIIEALKQYGVSRLDLFVATHGHTDHIGAADEVVNNIDVGRVLYNGEAASSKAYVDFVTAVRAKNLELNTAEPGQTFDLGDGVVLRVLAPIKPLFTEKDLLGMGNASNANSVVLRLSYGEFSMLFMGDAGADTERRLLQTGEDFSSKILKVGHHGSGNATMAGFLQAGRFEAAVISLGADNPYAHPGQETLDRLKAANVRVYRTDLQGEVTISSGGAGYDISSARTATGDVWLGGSFARGDASDSSDSDNTPPTNSNIDPFPARSTPRRPFPANSAPGNSNTGQNSNSNNRNYREGNTNNRN